MKYKLRLSPTQTSATPAEELLKLAILELLKKGFESKYQLMDEVLIQIKNRNLESTLQVLSTEFTNNLMIVRKATNLTIINLEEVPGE
jgi:predicted Zn-dependent protease with MMP-like domain